MKSTYLKIILKEIQQSIGRFLAIFGIVALGVGFLSGLLVTTPDMHHSVDAYYDRYELSDIVVKSTLGISEDDIKIIRALPDIEQSMPAYVSDLLMENESQESVAARIYGLPLTSDQIPINNLQLLKGRLPQSASECVVERESLFLAPIPIGSKLRISEDNKDYSDILDRMSVDTLTVVGIVANSYYFSLEREYTSVGSGNLDAILYTPYSSFNQEVYTDLYLTVRGAKQLDAFSPAYEAHIKRVTKQISAMEDERVQLRYDDVKKNAENALSEARNRYESGAQAAYAELAIAEEKLNAAKNALEEGSLQLESAKEELRQAKKRTSLELLSAQQQLDQNKEKLARALQTLRNADTQLLRSAQEIARGETEYARGEQELREAFRKLQQSEQQISNGEAELKRGNDELILGKLRLEQGEREIRASRRILDENESAYLLGKAQLDTAKRTLTQSLLPAMLHPALATYTSPDQILNILTGDNEAAKLALIRSLNDAGYDQAAINLLSASWRQIQSEEQSLHTARQQLEAGKQQLAEAERELLLARQEVASSEQLLLRSSAELAQGRSQLQKGWNDYRSAAEHLAASYKTLEAGKLQYQRGLQQSVSAWRDYQDGMRALQDGVLKLNIEQEKAKRVLDQAEQSLQIAMRTHAQGAHDLQQGIAQYRTEKLAAEQKLRDARNQLQDAQSEIDALELPKWYILDRNQNLGYASFVLNSEKVNAIAKVFPVFFYLIAALVALTTMTRMVEEERLQLGTLKSLGYSKTVISIKYLIYCGSASILGSIFGIQVGLNFMPYLIWNTYGVIYHLPDFQQQFDAPLVLSAALSAILSTMLTTAYVTYSSLKERPAVLLQPKAPKAGKRILLERIPLIWSHLSFNHKSTARNLLRYKKHFFMTIIGIGGCTALLLAGFGLRDSISTIIEKQFTEIARYDIQLGMDEELRTQGALRSILTDTARIADYAPIYRERFDLSAQEKTYQTTLLVPMYHQDLSRVVKLSSMSGDILTFSNDSVLITQKIADVLNLGIGDDLSISNDDRSLTLTITGITENYLGNYIYCARNIYEKCIGRSISENGHLIIARERSDSQLEALIRDLLAIEHVVSAEQLQVSKHAFENLLGSINYIVILIIVASGALAFIVLYNLTNININERKKELATLKVLGFYDGEVAAYIFRETFILTLLGIGFGLFLGTAFHRYMILTIEDVDFMFGRDIFGFSYVTAAFVTFGFSCIVNLFMYRKLKNIQMVDSMKAVD